MDFSTTHQVTATAVHDYTWRAPSPPHINVPPITGEQKLVLPNYEGIGGEEMTAEDLKTITQVQYVVADKTAHWKYEWRRNAQPILPFLYLGPSCASRDREFLQNADITMLLVIRDTKSAQARLLSGDRVADELGIASAAVDVAGNQELIAAFPRAVKAINDHLLSIYRRQSVANVEIARGSDATTQQTVRRGTVLVFCESGNERSATVVAAYLMSMYGLDLVKAIQFVQSQRFCVAFDDSLKSLLSSFQDILQAQRNVGHTLREQALISETTQSTTTKRSAKRHLEVDDDEKADPLLGQMDGLRFEGRSGFVPFIDKTNF